MRRYTFSDVLQHGLTWLLWVSPILLSGVLELREKRNWTLVFLVVYLVANAVRAWRDLSPMNWIRAKEQYVQRQIAFARLIKQMRLSGFDDRTLHDFQRECLTLIAGYTRAWRWDVYGTKIFANLITVDEGGATVTVIARDLEGPFGAKRQTPKRYKIEDRQAVKQAVETGMICEVGDIRLELPHASPEEYRSVLVLPLRKDPLGPVTAVISIDSSEPYHFAMEAEELRTHLQPYMAAIEETL
jgi:hypothetical protein